MRLSETFITAIRALMANKTRSFLTMLGVIIGVFAVLSLVSLVKGVENYVTSQFNSLGSNLIIISPGRASFSDDPSLSFSNNKFDESHVDLIQSNLGNLIVGVTPNIRISKLVRYKTKTYYATVVGSNEKVLDISDITLDSGRFFNKVEVSENARVAIIGHGAKEELFSTKSPVGASIKIDGHSYEVIGVVSPMGASSDDRVILPYTTVQSDFEVKQLTGITTKARDGEQIDYVMGQIELALLKDLKKDDFSVLSQQDILNSVQNVLGMLSLVLGAIAAISLVVGGIGIMNIMLVSVNERIKEIGLRKALGATSLTIALQFLTESVIISMTGGVLGIILGFLTTIIASTVIDAEIPSWALVVAFSFSLAVGILFGTYPAYKASKKDPIEALRYE